MWRRQFEATENNDGQISNDKSFPSNQGDLIWWDTQGFIFSSGDRKRVHKGDKMIDEDYKSTGYSTQLLSCSSQSGRL
jgi:hypothetical protein